MLNIGQNLIIPTKDTQESITYVVKKGDSLYAIARTYNTTVDNLKSLNNLTTDSLSIGQILKLPQSNGTPFPEAPSNTEDYVVKKGDSLYAIARTYNTTVDELKRINNLTSNNLSIGQILKIPKQTNENKVYTVKKGDSLYSIARNFDTTVSAISSLNNLSTNVLSIGQKLLLP